MNNFITTALLFFVLNTSHAQLTSDSIIGIWQDLPVMASGWSQNYRFFDDGTFIYSHNQMDCADSILTESGRYSLKKGKLKLKYNRMNYITGGTLQKSTGSCGSEYELVGGKEKEAFMKKKEKLTISGFIEDEFYDYLDCIKINGVLYWRMMSDPDEYD